MSLLSEIGLKVTNYLNNIKLYATKDSVANPTDCYFDFTEFYTNIIVDFENRISDLELDLADLQSDVADIEVDVADIEDDLVVVGADYAVDSGNSDSSNSSTSTYIQAGAFNAELVAKFSDSTTKFFVQAVATFTEGAGAQKGVQLKLQYSRNNGTWTDMPTGSASGNPGGGYQEDVNSSTTDTEFHLVNIFAAMAISSAGTYRFRLVFAAYVTGSSIVYRGSDYDGMIMAQEIKA